jgi:hypothetical protein
MSLESGGGSQYDDGQVLNTPSRAAPRVVNAVFLCPHVFAPMGDGPGRKAGRSSLFDCSTSPTH